MGLFPKDRDLTQPPEQIEFTVDASDLRSRVEDVHVRLDAFLVKHIKWRSRSSIQGLIRDGYLLVDPSSPDHPTGRGELSVERRPGRKLFHGSRVVVVIPEEYRQTPVSADIDGTELSVLYEDDEVVAIDKPAGMAVHPSGRHYGDTLIQYVHVRYKGKGLEQGRIPRLCHRLDRETSGIVLVSKNPLTHPDLMGQFAERRIEKEYLAIVEGEPDRDGGCIDMPLGPARASRIGLKMAVYVDGLESVTDWRVIERRGDCSLVACRPKTGRQHQIRVHLAAIGHPLVGDKLYGPDDGIFQRNVEGEMTEEDLRLLRLPRQALHNHRLVFKTPTTRERVEVVSPLAQDLVEFLESNRSSARREPGRAARRQ